MRVLLFVTGLFENQQVLSKQQIQSLSETKRETNLGPKTS
jgi:hypothetical protein